MSIRLRCCLCKGTRYSELYWSRDRMFAIDGAFRVVRCLSCGLVFISPQPSQSVLSRHYPSQKYYAYASHGDGGIFGKIRRYLIHHYYQPTLFSRALSLVVHNVPAIPSYVHRGRVLDIGCGSGDTLVLLKDLGWQTYGIDMDARAVRVAKKRGVEHVKVGAYRGIGTYPDGYFDAIRMYHVIEHVDDPLDCIRLATKKLKKGGELILGTPNISSLVSRVFRGYWYNLDSPRHLFVFNPHTLSAMMKKSHLSVGPVEYCSAGGIVGSIQYALNDRYSLSVDLIHNMFLVLLVYPLEWILDKVNLGDVFVLRGRT